MLKKNSKLECDKEFYELQKGKLREEIEEVRDKLNKVIAIENEGIANEDILEVSKSLDKLIVKCLS